MGRYALFFVQDPGGTRNLFPVFQKYCALQTASECPSEPILIASGKAPAVLRDFPQAGEVRIEIYEKIETVRQAYQEPYIVVSSMDSGTSLGREAMWGFGRNAVWKIAIPDSPWGRYAREWRNSCYWPDYLLVNDPLCKQIALDIWKAEGDNGYDYSADCVRIFPWAFLDRFAGFDRREQVARFVQAYGLDPTLPVVLFAAQLHGSSEVLRMVIDVLNDLRTRCYLVPRLHPRASQDEQRACQDALADFKLGPEYLLSDTAKDFPSLDTIMAAARVVISMYSLALVEAAALRRYPLAVLTAEGLRVYRQDIGEMPFKPPFAEMGIADVVESDEALRSKLEEALAPNFQNPLVAAQEEKLPIDGQNAAAIAHFLNTL